MHRAYQPTPPGPLSPPLRQNRVVLQREYRGKEAECFNILRDVIKDLTGEDLRRRQEILKKAIDLLSSFPERVAQASTLAANRAYTSTKPEGMALGHSGDSAKSSQWSHTWQFSNAEFDAAAPYHGIDFHNQQYHFMPAMESTFDQTSSPEYGGNMYNYPQFRRVF